MRWRCSWSNGAGRQELKALAAAGLGLACSVSPLPSGWRFDPLTRALSSGTASDPQNNPYQRWFYGKSEVTQDEMSAFPL